MHKRIIILVALIVGHFSAQANLLRNPGFEQVPGPGSGQGLMPSDWVRINETPDTYSNDGSYGITPGVFGNFPGTSAFDGLRWVAAWSEANEEFAQVLSTPLTPGEEYTLSGWMLQALRSDLDNPGGYEIILITDERASSDSGESLGFLGTTADLGDWQLFSLDFIAPSNANLLPVLVFSSKAVDSSTGSYAGLDNVSLNVSAVPLPMPLVLLSSGLLFILRKRMCARLV